MSTPAKIPLPREVFGTSAWAHLSRWAEERIADLRKRNDSIEMTPSDTAVIRGEIRALKKLLDLAIEPTPAIPATDNYLM